MVKQTRQHFISSGLVSENRKARFNYAISETFEAGLCLTGPEVKSLRQGRVNITDGFITPEGNNMVVNNITIGKYDNSDGFTIHTEKRKRQLLLNKKEIKRLIGLYSKEHITIVPLKLYFTEKGIAKLLIGVGVGKNKVDKREIIKQRDWNREKARLMKHK